MATVVKSMSVEGIDGFEIEVEATTIRGQQQMISIIGLGDQAVKEAGERMQAALEFCGYDIPKDKVIISLAPGNRRKKGSHYDLAMTVALLQQTDQITAKALEQYAFIGELSLNGRIRPCNGILPMVTEAVRRNIRSVIVPYENWEEAESVSGIEVIGVRTLRDTIKLLEGGKKPEKEARDDTVFTENTSVLKSIDFADVKGQEELIDAIVLGAAGGTQNDRINKLLLSLYISKIDRLQNRSIFCKYRIISRFLLRLFPSLEKLYRITQRPNSNHFNSGNAFCFFPILVRHNHRPNITAHCFCDHRKNSITRTNSPI